MLYCYNNLIFTHNSDNPQALQMMIYLSNNLLKSLPNLIEIG